MNYPTWQLKKSKHVPYLTTGRYKNPQGSHWQWRCTLALGRKGPKARLFPSRPSKHATYQRFPRTTCSLEHPRKLQLGSGQHPETNYFKIL
jgi:hypothetical protein